MAGSPAGLLLRPPCHTAPYSDCIHKVSPKISPNPLTKCVICDRIQKMVLADHICMINACGSGSGVEHRLAKARVASSNLVFRSIFYYSGNIA